VAAPTAVRRPARPAPRAMSDRWAPPPYRVPEGPGTGEYARAHRRFTEDALDDPGLRERLRTGAPLPAGYGIGLDERVVEWPWIAAHAAGGPALDSGSTLNHAHVLDRVLDRLAPLHVATLRPEGHAFTEHGVSYVYADLRDLPLRDARFATVVCASTLEHVGMDNSLYGGPADRAPDPDAEVARAISELHRVTAPGGVALVTVPFGRAEDFGWFRQIDGPTLERWIAASGASGSEVEVFAYGPDGWQRTDPAAAAGARYHDHRAAGGPAPDGAAAARAVACVRLVWEF